MRKRSIVILALVWLVLLVAGVSSAITMAVCGVFEPGQRTIPGEEYEVSAQQYEMIQRYQRLDDVRQQLESGYYQPLDQDQLILGAIQGMTASLGDPYTFYYTPEEMEELSRHSLGVYQGIGILLSADQEGNVLVLRVFPGSPAQEAGVLAGDVILELDDIPVSGETQQMLDETIDRIAGASNKMIKLTLQRGNRIFNLGMTSATIEMERVQWKMLDHQVGYIAIYEFVGDDVKGFDQAMKYLQEQGATKVILDVRSNPGGLLEDVIQIADVLMGEGLIVYTQDRDGRRSEYFSDAAMWDVELAVLINGMSASASEILAGALQDAGRAIVVGENSFGKGIVQTVLTFQEDGAGMQLTTASYYTSSGTISWESRGTWISGCIPTP